MKRESYILMISCIVASLLTAWSSSHAADTSTGDGVSAKESYPAVPGELIVRTKSVDGVVKSSLIRSLTNILGEAAEGHFAPFHTDRHLGLIKLSRAESVDRVMAILRANPDVEVVEPNYILNVQGWRDDAAPTPALSKALTSAGFPGKAAAGIPNDPDFAKTWGLYNTGQTDAAGQVGTAGADVEVLDLWAKGMTGSRDILVAVIDTGIDWQHPDLVDNLYTNPGEAGALANNGKDDDGNGFIDDVHGWNFNAGNNNSDDDHDHGTHCAGTIGASGDNGIGVAGVNWKVSLLPVKFLSASGSGTTAGAIESINYARKMKVRVMSNSWGGGAFSDTLKKAIEDAEKAGILFVAAAGNDGLGTPSYPAGYEVSNIVAVAATDNRDVAAKFSNVNKYKVHVAAPGVKVWSTVKDGKYSAFSGTSMATPHVAGLAALLLSGKPDLAYAELKQHLVESSTPVDGLRSKVIAHGRVSARNSEAGVVPASGEPAETAWTDVKKTIESAHPYANGTDQVFTAEYAGAKYIRVVFDKVEIEEKYDRVTVEDPKAASTAAGGLDLITSPMSEAYTSDYVEGDKINVRLKADSDVNGYGFKISKIQVIMAGQ